MYIKIKSKLFKVLSMCQEQRNSYLQFLDTMMYNPSCLSNIKVSDQDFSTPVFYFINFYFILIYIRTFYKIFYCNDITVTIQKLTNKFIRIIKYIVFLLNKYLLSVCLSQYSFLGKGTSTISSSPISYSIIDDGISLIT